MIELGLSDRTFNKLARAHWRPIQYLNDVPLFAKVPDGWILHVAEGKGSLFNLFNHNVKGQRKFSTGWVDKNGTVEMYGSLYREPWAQVAGNSSYWAFETEGFSTEPLTDPQIWALARIHALLSIAAGRNYDQVINAPGKVGIGTHSMGGAAWGGHACPGNVRAAQRGVIIERSKRFWFKRR